MIVLIPNALYEVRSPRKQGQNKEREKDAVFVRTYKYRYLRTVGNVALFRHEQGKYIESFRVLDIQNQMLTVKLAG